MLLLRRKRAKSQQTANQQIVEAVQDPNEIFKRSSKSVQTITFFLWLYLLDCTSYVCRKSIKKKVKDNISLYHIKVFLSLNLFFLVHPLANLALRGFDPAVADKCWNYGNFAFNCTHFWKLHTFLQVQWNLY